MKRWGRAGICAAVALGMTGCTAAKRVYVPRRCIQAVKWSRPCEPISESLIKCDGVMVRVSCVSAAQEGGGKLERKKFME